MKYLTKISILSILLALTANVSVNAQHCSDNKMGVLKENTPPRVKARVKTKTQVKKAQIRKTGRAERRAIKRKARMERRQLKRVARVKRTQIKKNAKMRREVKKKAIRNQVISEMNNGSSS